MKTFTTFLSEIGGFVSIMQSVATLCLMFVHYRGIYQEMTQRIFVFESKDNKDEPPDNFNKVGDSIQGN